MKTLAEFETLEEAKAYTQARGKMIHRNTMNLILAQNGCYNRLKDISENPIHPMRDLVSAFVDSTEYNLIQTSVTGQGVIQLMQTLIAAEGDDPALQSVLDMSIAAANETYYPYVNATEYDFKRAKGLPITQKEATPVNGYIKITTTADCEAHRPQIYVDVQGVKKQVGTAPEISSAADYLVRASSNQKHYIDNYYGVM